MTFRLTFVALSALALAACSEEPAPAPAATQEAAPAPVASMAAPDEQLFADLHAATCPDAKPVSTSVCKRLGIGSEDVLCEYGLGDDEYLRNKATLTPQDEEWTIADPETVCAAGA